jgi:hypothetical protein
VFHVPELARLTPNDHPILGSTAADGNNGAFQIESPEPGWRLFLIASDGTEALDVADWQWEHVSVRAASGARSRTPTWKEMSYVKRLCWDADDVVMQLHPRESEYVNCHPHVLHLWRPKHQEIPTPPSVLVGPRSEVTETRT